jgi:hypothetical protein
MGALDPDAAVDTGPETDADAETDAAVWCLPDEHALTSIRAAPITAVRRPPTARHRVLEPALR